MSIFVKHQFIYMLTFLLVIFEENNIPEENNELLKEDGKLMARNKTDLFNPPCAQWQTRNYSYP